MTIGQELQIKRELKEQDRRMMWAGLGIMMFAFISLALR